MKSYIGVTDYDWFELLSRLPELEEVNFWTPSGNQSFRAINPGDLFLFKLHFPLNFIVGGGFFTHFSILPISLAWESFHETNSAKSYDEMRTRIAKYLRAEVDRSSDYKIGCILLSKPFFLPRNLWIPTPSDWSSNIVRGKTYDLSHEPGLSLWNKLQEVMPLGLRQLREEQRYGEPVLVHPRLGQGSFRVLVTDKYERRCAVSNERTLPVLDAAHIKPYSANGQHIINNGILLRKDIHTLFDLGYITVTPKLVVEVSNKIKEEYENGRDYYRFHGTTIHIPQDPSDAPSPEFLLWHNDHSFRG